jgi:hypothetical protein
LQKAKNNFISNNKAEAVLLGTHREGQLPFFLQAIFSLAIFAFFCYNIYIQ